MMCAQAAAPHAGGASRAASTARRSASSTASSRATARTLRWVLRHQTADAAASRSRRSSAHRRPLHHRAEGLLPGAGHRRDPRHLRGAADGLVRRHGRAAAGARPRSSCRIPAVESLSSFIGIDGTNTTLNSGRIQINLKPLDERDASAPPTSSAACSRSSPTVDGHHALHAAGAGPDRRGPRQPHAVPVQPRGSPNAAELHTLGAAAGRAAAGAARAARRRQRPAERRPARRRS